MMQSKHHFGRRSEKTPSPATSHLFPEFIAVNQLFVEVKFGIASRNCDNYGVCQVDAVENLWKAENDNTCNCLQKSRAIMSIDGFGNIELAFPKALISEEIIYRNFDNFFFTVGEDYQISNEIIKKYKISGIPKILNGRYEIQETTGFYIIQFNPDFRLSGAN